MCAAFVTVLILKIKDQTAVHFEHTLTKSLVLERNEIILPWKTLEIRKLTKSCLSKTEI